MMGTVVTHGDLIYYSRRLNEERARSRDAATPEAYLAHSALADLYEQKLRGLDIARQTNTASKPRLSVRYNKDD